MRLSWALVHSKQPEDVQCGIAMLEDLPKCTKKKNKKSKGKKKKELPEQTDPPSIPIVELFPSGKFPEGEIQQYKDDLVLCCSPSYGGLISHPSWSWPFASGAFRQAMEAAPKSRLCALCRAKFKLHKRINKSEEDIPVPPLFQSAALWDWSVA